LEWLVLMNERTRRPDVPVRTSTIEVRVYRDRQFIFSQLCESEEETAVAVRGWEAIDGVVCEVDDLTDGSRHGHLVESEPWHDEARSGAAAEQFAGRSSQ
jgi:hypothetical protein